MFWKFIFTANIIVLIRYISLISYKIKVEQQMVNSYNAVFETDSFNFGMTFFFVLTAFAICFMIITALAMFEKGFKKNFFNKTFFKFLFWLFILPVMLFMSVSCLFNAFISNVWQVSLKNILFVLYNIIILTGCAKLAYSDKSNNELE